MERNDTPAAAGPSLDLGDIYYVLFRHKWKIVICCVLGLGGALAVFKFRPPPYQSEAKLFVRYVVTEGRTIGPGSAGDAMTKSPDIRGETIMNSEVEILTSLDLAEEVARQIGPDKILAKFGGGNNPLEAAAIIQNNLTVDVTKLSSVIHVVFTHPDPEITQSLLRALIDAYLKKHAETHRPGGMMDDFLTQETDQLRARLAQTEEELRKVKNQAGVISLEDSSKMLASQIDTLTGLVFSTQAELAERTSELEVITKRLPQAPAADDKPATPVPEIPADKRAEYQKVAARADLLRRREEELLTQFTGESPRVQEVRAQLASLDEQRQRLETEFPGIAGRAPVATSGAQRPMQVGTDPAIVVERIAALQGRLKVLNAQLEEVRTRAAKVEELEVSILELRRRKEVLESNYKNFASNLEQSRINQALGSGKVSNINEIQTPSPPARDVRQVRKLAGGIAGGGVALGFAWAFLIELYMDRSIRRPKDIQKNLRIPLFLTLPRFSRRQIRMLAAGKSGMPALPAPAPTDGAQAAAKAGAAHTSGEDKPELALATHSADGAATLMALDPYHETLRDRLISYFDSVNLRHKPKLVAITGIGRGAGVTSTAAGLARSFSETGEGNVLLVDMTQGQGAAQQFCRGNAVCGLEEVLTGRENAQIESNLYVVGHEPNTDRMARVLPQRFNKIVPKLKASDFDYIIFDMPPVSQISITPRLAGFMDMVLMVVESEKTDRELLGRAVSLLKESKTHVGAVLNKTRTYVPSSLHQEYLPNI